MNDLGYVKVSAVCPDTVLADPCANAAVLADTAAEIDAKGEGLILFPELCLTGRTAGDLFFSRSFLKKTEEAFTMFLKKTEKIGSVMVIGLPVMSDGRLFNCSAVIQKGRLLGLVPKKNADESGGGRWFTDGDLMREDAFPVPCGRLVFEDPDGLGFAVVPGSDMDLVPSYAAELCADGAVLILNPSSRDFLAGGEQAFQRKLAERSAAWTCAIASCSSGLSESTTDAVCSGGCYLYENGEMLFSKESPQAGLRTSEADFELLAGLRLGSSLFMPGDTFERVAFDGFTFNDKDLLRTYSRTPFLPDENRDEYLRQIFEIQASGLAMRLKRAYSGCAVIGTSGGSDSTLALAAAARAAQMLGKDPSFVLAVTMPGFGTSSRTKNNAMDLMKALGCEVLEISIAAAAKSHLEDIGHDLSVRNAAYENAQARERTQVLMDLANDRGGLVVGTGDLSETALGWCTYGGDQLSMYGVNSGLTKGMVKEVIRVLADDCLAGRGAIASCADAKLLAKCLYDILDTPVSPELLPTDENGKIAQITEDKVGPYELHDFFLYHMIFCRQSRNKTAWLAKRTFSGSYDEAAVDKWLSVFCRRFMSQQFKRDCSAGAPRVMKYSVSPRGGLMMPSDASGSFWL